MTAGCDGGWNWMDEWVWLVEVDVVIPAVFSFTLRRSCSQLSVPVNSLLRLSASWSALFGASGSLGCFFFPGCYV